MKHKYTPEETDLFYQFYSSKGPKWIGEQLGISMKTISKKARRLGLYRGQEIANKERKNTWFFDKWSYNLGYIEGVYLGDGNVWRGNTSSYFRLSVIDEDFCRAIQVKLKRVTGYDSNIHYQESKKQYCLNFCNKDFASWLTERFGPANNKRLQLLPILEANKGMLEGLMDSEGTITKSYSVIRMDANLSIVQEICKQLGIEHTPQHKGVRKETWQSPTFQGYSINNKEYTRVGLGTYIKRKAINGIIYKDICWEA